MRDCPVALLLTAVLLSGTVLADDDTTEADKLTFSRGFGYLGAFAVTQTSTELSLFSTNLPLGARLDINEDLGVRDSFTVPRAMVGWRFGKRHLLGGGYYNLNRDGVKTLEREIELPGEITLPIGFRVATEFTTEIGKIQYTYMFHRDRKVMLGFGAGLFIAKLGVGFEFRGSAGEEVVESTAKESVTAPLPLLGFRLAYKVSTKWQALFSSDWFLLDYSDYKGVLNDTQFYFSHQTFKHVGFAGGINIQSFNIDILDDDLQWELDSGLVGFLGVVTFYF